MDPYFKFEDSDDDPDSNIEGAISDLYSIIGGLQTEFTGIIDYIDNADGQLQDQIYQIIELLESDDFGGIQGDMNSDGQLNIFDIVMLVEEVLGVG